MSGVPNAAVGKIDNEDCCIWRVCTVVPFYKCSGANACSASGAVADGRTKRKFNFHL